MGSGCDWFCSCGDIFYKIKGFGPVPFVFTNLSSVNSMIENASEIIVYLTFQPWLARIFTLSMRAAATFHN